MYGTVAKLKAKPGSEALLQQLGQDIEAVRPVGLVGSWIYKLDSDPDAYILVVAFESKESYFANAESPEQDARYQTMRALLVDDPEWQDGEIVYASTPAS